MKQGADGTALIYMVLSMVCGVMAVYAAQKLI